MDEVLRAASTSWRDALLGSSKPAVQRASEMILNVNRANWHLLTDLPIEGRVLDLGAGMGTTSHALSSYCREVVAVEPVAERVQFMKYRFEQEGIRNVRIVRGTLWDLPFSGANFDLIAMNGVLEWVPQGRQGDPKALQRLALKIVSDLLRPGGVLYLGIENRFVPGYFVGYPDPHAGIPWVTVLPRRLAQFYARWKGERDGYRNYLYSAAGYRRLLGESGFRSVECYLALPSYNDPKFYMPLQNNVFSYFARTFSGVAGSPRRRAIKAMLPVTLLKHLEYSFALMATK